MKIKKRSLYIFVAAIILLWCYFAVQAFSETIVTDSTTDSTVDSKIDSTTTVKSPPPSAISPSISASGSDLCTVGIAGAVQTQILGFSAGKSSQRHEL